MVKMRNFTLFSAAFAAALLLATTLSTCESTLGFGKAIDFVLPELTLDPGPNPQYVTYTSIISGKITDDIAVDRVELREADTGKKLFTATLSGSGPREKRFSMVMDFREVTLELKSGTKTGEELNGERIGVEIVGYDKAGNSHIAAITLIIDMREPFTTDIEIERTSTGNKRTGFIEPIADLKDLEETDPYGFISANANKYQNGRFTIKAKLDESETRIVDDDEKTVRLKLNIYDEDRQNDPLLSLKRDAGSSIFSPVWSLLDEDIITAGTAKSWTKDGINYATAYHNGKRFYYRVEVVAIDESGNELHDYRGWFCMWQDGDIPKGVLDPSFGGEDPNIASYVDRGTPLPVEFFDDDALDWAYTGLLTKAQWEGMKRDDDGALDPAQPVYIAPGTPGVQLPQFTDLTTEAARDAAKLDWLKKRLKGEENAGDVYNWKYDIYLADTGKHETITAVTDIEDEYEKTVYVETGNQESDYGEFVLFTLTADKKLPPHNPAYTGAIETLKPQWKGRAWKIQVIDSNAPIIVFDTVDTTASDYKPGQHPGNETDPNKKTGNSPEENTFPQLRDGRYFEINGYTLRENGNGHNSVNTFRLAWIPYGADGPDALIEQVQNALSSTRYPDPDPNVPNSDWPAGVQHWDLHSKMVEGTPQPISGIEFRKQVFRKTFDVLGGIDDINNGKEGSPTPAYYNFRTGDESSPRENETKLFIFYAKDNAGHGVFRQLRLLGNRTPPNIIVYDLTNRSVTINEGPPSGLPDLNNEVIPTNPTERNNYYFYNSTGLIDTDGRTRYENTRKLYQPTGFNLLKAIAMQGNTLLLGPSDIASTNAAYPRETVIKYWVAAQSNGDLAVDDVFMRDITFSDNPELVGYYDDNISLSYIEKVSEVTQRVFLFEATDSLGNTARIQRTVAVTNAAVLSSITTTTQTGSYGISANTTPPTLITLQANFTNLVRWTKPNTNPDTDAERPKLNVRYNKGGVSQMVSIPTSTPSGQASLSLDFPITVYENDTGVIETIYFGILNSNGHTATGTEAARTNRPITIPDETRLLDASRGDDAFTPRNSAGFDWTSNKGSLQASKTITLQGVRPVRNNFTLTSIPSGKTRYTDTYPGLYYKVDETVEFTLTAANNVPIFTGAVAPVIQFQIGGTWHNAPWAKAGATSSQMVFSVLVNNTNINTNGIITAIRLNDSRSIVDSVGNAFVAYVPATPAIDISTNGQVRIESYGGFTGNVNVTIDKANPNAPGTTLNGTSVGSTPAVTLYYNTPPPVLAIPNNTSGESAPVAATQYSLNNGVTWQNFPTAINTTAQPWTTAGAAANTLNIRPGQWTLVTRYTDRAGNEGATTTQSLHVNDAFPKLIAVTPVQANGWHRSGNLQFDLNFEDQVQITAGNTISITLKNRSTANNGDNDTLASTATAISATAPAGGTALASTIRVSFNVATKEMRDGLYVSAVNFGNLRDRFDNVGGTYSGNWSGAAGTGTAPTINPNTSTCTNLGAGLRVDAIAPTVSTYSPVNSTGVSSYPTTGDDRRNVITLTFSEPVIKGSGTITIKPKSDFLIPPVFEDNGYYMDCVTEAKANASSNRTIWMPGFYDIYNNNALNAADRNKLTESTTQDSQRATASASVVPSSALDETNPSMTRLRLDARTGQPVGPYVKTTQGLKSGNDVYGYSGLYNGGNNTAGNTSDSAETAFFKQGPNTDGSASGLNGAMPAFRAMIPDTATKWVLAYQYSIHNDTSSQEDPAKTANGYGKTTANLTGVVPGIRDVLVKTKFRWQEIDVAWSNVVINGSTVTITLIEPLLKGLQWELTYPTETFTDQAGNNVPVIGTNAYTFWSEGVQKPVIRVNRKSYDARTAAWQAPRGANEDTRNYTYAAPAANSGWGITDFNTIDYRIESETPGASIYYALSTLRNSTYPIVTDPQLATENVAFNAVSVTGNWTGNVPNVAAVSNQYTQDTWDRNTPNQPRSFWVRPNLIRRDGYSGGNESADQAAVRCRYYVNGDLRYSAGTLRMFRSYNRDATLGTANGVPGLDSLDTLTLGIGTQGNGVSWHKGTVTFRGLDEGLEAGKRYVVAEARRSTYTSNKGYEGIFRTLIVLNGQTGSGRQNTNGEGGSRGKILVEGSNIKAGLPSVAGFPVQDGSDSGDSRFAKMMFNVDHANPNSTTIAANEATNRRFYWVSTEIVCEWYFVYFGNGGRYMRTGDVNNYMMVSYGDLTYGYAVHRFPD